MASRRPALSVVFVVVLVDLLGFGVVLPNLAFYARDFGASAFQIGILYSAYSFAQLFAAPFWGSLSDRYGRRPVMLVSTFAAAAAYLLLAFSRSFSAFLAARLIAGFMAGNIAAAQAYVADVTAPENRARGMGLIGAAFGIGFTLGPAIGALVSHVPVAAAVADAYPAVRLGALAAAMSLTSFLLVAFALPESRRAGKGRAAPMDSVFSTAFWSGLGPGRAGAALSFLFAAAFALSFSQANLYGAFPLFCASRYGFGAREVALSYVYMGTVSVIVQGVLIRPLVARFGEKKLFTTGLAVMAAGFSALPAGGSSWSVGGALGAMALGGALAIPTLTSLVSQQAGSERYGAVLGASQALGSLGRATGPAVGGLLYTAMAPLPFFVPAVVLALTAFGAAGAIDRRTATLR